MKQRWVRVVGLAFLVLMVTVSIGCGTAYVRLHIICSEKGNATAELRLETTGMMTEALVDSLPAQELRAD